MSFNAFSNLKRGLHLRTKIKSNRCLDIGTEGVVQKHHLRYLNYAM